MRKGKFQKPDFYLVSTACALILLLFIILTGTTFGNQKTIDKNKGTKSLFTERVIKDINRGIESDNTGLKKSAIYMAGYYQLDGTVNQLIKELGKEPETEIKVLIALALYRIGTEEAMDAVTNLADNDKDIEVRKAGVALIHQKSTDTKNVSALR